MKGVSRAINDMSELMVQALACRFTLSIFVLCEPIPGSK